MNRNRSCTRPMSENCLTENKIANLFPLGRGGGEKRFIAPASVSKAYLQLHLGSGRYAPSFPKLPIHYSVFQLVVLLCVAKGYLKIHFARGLHSPVWSKYIILKFHLSRFSERHQSCCLYFSATTLGGRTTPLLLRWFS